MDSSVQFKPIGYLKSCFPDKFGVPRQSGVVENTFSELSIHAEFQPEISLQGLIGYSHIWLQFVFHLNSSNKFHAKVHPPRLGGKTMGLFATRSPHRPNPIGLSLVKLIEVKNDTLLIEGADLVDGTPILDIKPYLPQFESIPEAKAGWSSRVEVNSITVDFEKSALQKIEIWMSRKEKPELKQVIENILKQDPRPVVYRGFEDGDSPYRTNHAFRLYDGDVHFRFTSATHVIVFDILF